MTLTVPAERARTDMVQDPVHLPDRQVEFHAFREYVTAGKKIPAVLTLEVHGADVDEVGRSSGTSLLLHFDAEKLMAALTAALLDADA